MSLTVSQVLKPLDAADIEYIIQYRESSQFRRSKDEPARSLKFLCDTVSATGLNLMIANLPREMLVDFAESEKLTFAESYLKETQKPSPKLITKRLIEKIAEVGAKNWFISLSESVLKDLLDDAELEEPTKFEKAAVAKMLLNKADLYGLENLFSTFTGDRLHKFAINSGLKAPSTSKNNLIDCLITRQNIKAPKKVVKKAEPKVSKTKPQIKKGISAVDLNSHFYLKDLSDWLSENELPSSGSKKVMVKRILDHFDGKDVSLKEKAVKKRKAAAPPKKTTTTKKAKVDEKEKAEEKPKPKADEKKPKADEKKPKVDEKKPKVDEKKPKADEKKPAAKKAPAKKPNSSIESSK